MRTAEEIDGMLKQLIMQKAWFLEMARARVADLDSWMKTLRHDQKRDFPEYISKVQQ